jgi:POT family proton-dependent oligopeptide transporter
VMLPQGVGNTLEGFYGMRIYEMFASKENFSRELLAERGMSADKIDAIPTGEGFKTLMEFTGESHEALTLLLSQTHNIGMAWYIIGAIGSISAVGIYFYGRWLMTIRSNSAA